jgi:hypothetical protein
MLKTIASFLADKSFTSSGYQRFSNGLIVQWGSVNAVSSTNATFTFPIAFPTAALQVVATVDAGAAFGGRGAYIEALSASAATVNQAIGATTTIRVIAIGH